MHPEELLSVTELETNLWDQIQSRSRVCGHCRQQVTHALPSPSTSSHQDKGV